MWQMHGSEEEGFSLRATPQFPVWVAGQCCQNRKWGRMRIGRRRWGGSGPGTMVRDAAGITSWRRWEAGAFLHSARLLRPPTFSGVQAGLRNVDTLSLLCLQICASHSSGRLPSSESFSFLKRHQFSFPQLYLWRLSHSPAWLSWSSIDA